MSEHLEIYKIVVNTITANEERRQRTAIAYIGMLSAIVMVASALPKLPLVIPALVILVIALTWFATVLYFRRLAQAKFAVIAEIEQNLVLAAFKQEWRYFKGRNCYFKLSLTYLEMVVPTGACLISASYILYWSVCQILAS
ncbi:MAG: hypothetical protein OXK72_08375 [Gammaproteobacteria bacterium]|nr:hypothetical protein [Gammaproteobacteria bacterium]MDE0412535.1 hypothetical protein [Gammaproteobacteria bacterium]